MEKIFAKVAVQALRGEKFPQTIRNSYKHTGIYPFNAVAIRDTLKVMKTTPLPEYNQEIVDLVNKHAEKLIVLKQIYSKQRKRRRRVDSVTSEAIVLSTTAAIATITCNSLITEIRSLKAETLRKTAAKLIGRKNIFHPFGTKYLRMDQIRVKLKDYLETKVYIYILWYNEFIIIRTKA